jgi:hypothetical protein
LGCCCAGRCGIIWLQGGQRRCGRVMGGCRVRTRWVSPCRGLPAPFIHRLPFLRCPSSFIIVLSFVVVLHPSLFVLCPLLFVLHPLLFVLCPPLFVVCCLFSVVHCLLFIVCSSLFLIRRSLFVVRLSRGVVFGSGPPRAGSCH